MAKASSNIDALIKRISVRTRRYVFSDADAKKRLTRIALLLENQTKINIRRQGIVDTGNLLNSIQSRVVAREHRAIISYGSFGVAYAGLHEFGGPFTDRMRRAMFAKLRARGAPPKPGKGIVQGGYIRARPYIRPSLIQQRRRILEILKAG
jgi:phage gpG-like protein